MLGSENPFFIPLALFLVPNITSISSTCRRLRYATVFLYAALVAGFSPTASRYRPFFSRIAITSLKAIVGSSTGWFLFIIGSCSRFPRTLPSSGELLFEYSVSHTHSIPATLHPTPLRRQSCVEQPSREYRNSMFYEEHRVAPCEYLSNQMQRAPHTLPYTEQLRPIVLLARRSQEHPGRSPLRRCVGIQAFHRSFPQPICESAFTPRVDIASGITGITK